MKQLKGMIQDDSRKFNTFSSCPGKVNACQDPTDVDQKKPLSCRNNEEKDVQEIISNQSVNNPSARNLELD